jgi:hypothetical protein
MHTKEAKDFLVEQTTQQAAIQGVALSDLEKRMMYFTEWDDSCENPIQLNEEFEAQYDTAAYEAKMAGLLKSAYKRAKTESPTTRRLWDEALHILKKGDHYILVLWRSPAPSEHPRRDAFIQIGIGVAIAFLIALAIAIKELIAKR